MKLYLNIGEKYCSAEINFVIMYKINEEIYVCEAVKYNIL